MGLCDWWGRMTARFCSLSPSPSLTSTRSEKAPIMADVPLSKGSNCEVTNEVTVLFLDDGRVFQHRVV